MIWLWRAACGGFAIAYLLSGTLQTWVPPLPPFLAAAAVELQFFVSGLRAGRVPGEPPDRGPQPRDLAELGFEVEDRPVRRPSRAGTRLVQLVLVLTLLSGLFLLDRSRPSWQKLPAHERAATLVVLRRQASLIAGHPAVVICDTTGRRVGYVQDADGLAEVGGRRMWLTPGVCYRLAETRRTRRAAGAAGQAIAVLAHEAWHLHGVGDEAVANCYAYQSGVRVGRALGLREETARRLMQEQLAQNPADFADAPAYVVPGSCGRGGALDLGLDGSHFP